jgi:hypothetical protein
MPHGPVPDDVVAAMAAMAEPRPLRRGSLTERLMRCGKDTCACRRDAAARHGPYIEWSRVIDGRRVSRYLTPEQADLVRVQIEAGHGFRADLEAYWRACERWADSEIGTAGDAGDEKGGSPRPSARRSPPR